MRGTGGALLLAVARVARPGDVEGLPCGASLEIVGEGAGLPVVVVGSVFVRGARVVVRGDPVAVGSGLVATGFVGADAEGERVSEGLDSACFGGDSGSGNGLLASELLVVRGGNAGAAPASVEAATPGAAMVERVRITSVVKGMVDVSRWVAAAVGGEGPKGTSPFTAKIKSSFVRFRSRRRTMCSPGSGDRRRCER